MKNRLLLILPALLLGGMGCKSDYEQGLEKGFKAGQSFVFKSSERTPLDKRLDARDAEELRRYIDTPELYMELYPIYLESQQLRRQVREAKLIKVLQESEPAHFPEQTEEYNRGYKEGWHAAIDVFLRTLEEANRS